MSDIVDIAQEKIEILHSAALAQRKPAGPVATGQCLYCGASLPPEMRWCNRECRDEWQFERDMSAQNG